MNLSELVAWPDSGRASDVGAKIPWNDPDFSKRMLASHLDQDHDLASRRADLISVHVAALDELLEHKPSRILDLGCGPGFYAGKLAELGHTCLGVDFSPASVEYAMANTPSGPGRADFVQADIRDFQSEREFDCVLLIFGEFNVFSRSDAHGLLRKCSGLLRPGGLFVLEAHTYDAVRAIGREHPSWQRKQSGLFSELPHLCLQENHWNAAEATALQNYFIVDAASGQVDVHSSFMQAYRNEEYWAMLKQAGLPCAGKLTNRSWPSGAGFAGNLQVFVCRKQA